MPTGGKLTCPLLGWASAEFVSLGTALGDLVSAFADDAGDDDAAEDEDEPYLLPTRPCSGLRSLRARPWSRSCSNLTIPRTRLAAVPAS